VFTSNYIFFDFDGVIKDSVEVKSRAFEELFREFDRSTTNKIIKHHEENGGMSRFDKLPIYLKWTGQFPSKALVADYSEKFSLLVKQNVIESEWVPGVLDYMRNHIMHQTFFLVTATPQIEIEEILEELKIQKYFKNIIGTPTRKVDAIKMLLAEYSISPDQAVMVGDSRSDYEAATENHVPFVLRRTNLNQALQERLTCPMIDDF